MSSWCLLLYISIPGGWTQPSVVQILSLKCRHVQLLGLQATANNSKTNAKGIPRPKPSMVACEYSASEKELVFNVQMYFVNR